MTEEKQKDWRETPFEYPDFISWLEKHIGLVLAIVGVAIIFLGFNHVRGDSENKLFLFIEDLYANGGSELLSIAVTVLIIERLNERRSKRDEAIREQQIKDEAEAREKADLILQMGSPDNAFAREAVRKLRARGWLTDGSVKGAKLSRAKLEGADLVGANLEGADLNFANLEGAHLMLANLAGAGLVGAKLEGAGLEGAKLEGAGLEGANLSKADLVEANLQGANLWEANLSEVDLEGARFDEKTILTDTNYIGKDEDFNPVFDKYWTPETDMSRYTDPDHPNFWRSDDPFSSAYAGVEPE